MSVEYTVYVNIEAYDEKKRNMNEDDCWHPSEERNLGTFDSLELAEQFKNTLPEKEQV